MIGEGGLLKDRVAIITGASSGIGHGIARRFGEEGAITVVAARRKNKLDALVEEIKSNGGRALAIQCDIMKEEDIDNVVAATVKEFGTIHILVNNAQAGISDVSPLEKCTSDGLLDAMRGGPLQSMLFIQKCLPYMKKQHYGKIINLSSGASLPQGPSGYAAYSMAKAAINLLSRDCTLDFTRYGICTNTIYPFLSSEATELLESRTGEAADNTNYLSMIPAGYRGEGYKDASPLIAMLCSDYCNYISGQSIAIDGGLYHIN